MLKITASHFSFAPLRRTSPYSIISEVSLVSPPLASCHLSSFHFVLVSLHPLTLDLTWIPQFHLSLQPFTAPQFTFAPSRLPSFHLNLLYVLQAWLSFLTSYSFTTHHITLLQGYFTLVYLSFYLNYCHITPPFTWHTDLTSPHHIAGFFFSLLLVTTFTWL